jgi:DNA-binding response OmpR family regulator
MYQLGVINKEFSDGSVIDEYKDFFEENNFKVTEITGSIQRESTKELDICIVFVGSSQKSVVDVYEVINDLRKINSRALIFACHLKADRYQRLLCLQFGVDGNTDIENHTPREVQLMFQNLLRNRQMGKIRGALVKGRSKREGSVKVAVDDHLCTLYVNEKEIRLSRKECQVMDVLCKKVGEICTYEEIQQVVWGVARTNERYRIANIIFHIRKKMHQKKILSAHYIETIRSVGYRMLP